MAQKQAVKFVKVPRERVCEIPEREKVYMADCLYIGESGTIYFVSDYETPVNNKILYNNNIKEEKVEPISKEEVESNPFLEGIQFKSYLSRSGSVDKTRYRPVPQKPQVTSTSGEEVSIDGYFDSFAGEVTEFFKHLHDPIIVE